MAAEEPILPQKVNIPRGINAIYVQDLKTLSELPNDAVFMVVLNDKPYKITGGQLKQLLIIEGDNVYAPLVDGKVPVDYLPSSNSDINDVLGAGNQAIDKEVRFGHSFTSALSVLDENMITFTFEASESFITAVESRLKNISVQDTKITDVADGTEPTDAATFGQLSNKVDKSTILKIGDVEYDLSQNRTFPIPIGSGGYEANVYLSATDSVTAGYKNLLYSPDVSETIKTITANNNTVQGEKYLYDAQIGTDIIPSGEWKFKLYGKLSAVSGGTTTVNIRVFRYDISGIEYDILNVSKLITNTTNDTIQFTATQVANVACDLTDRIGIQISLTTTRNSNTTFTYSLGDGYAAFINTTIPLRHELLRGIEEPNQHPIDAITDLRKELSIIKKLDDREIIDGQGIAILPSAGTFGDIYSSSLFGCTSYIYCKDAIEIDLRMPRNTSEPSQGLVFYDSNKIAISTNYVLIPQGTIGYYDIIIKEIPVNAIYFRTCYWNFDNSALYGEFQAQITFKKGVLGQDKYMPFQSGQIHFRVRVNQSVSNFWDTKATNQEPESFKGSTGVMILPDSYDQHGKPCKIIMFGHGMSRNVTYTQWGLNDANYLAQKERFRSAGYAVFDCNGQRDNGGSNIMTSGCPQVIDAYRKCFEYIRDNYNVEDSIYVIGASMGGLIGLNYTFAYNNVKALALLSPWTDLYNCSWIQGIRDVFVEYYGFLNNSNYELEKAELHSPSSKMIHLNNGNTVDNSSETLTDNTIIQYSDGTSYSPTTLFASTQTYINCSGAKYIELTIPVHTTSGTQSGIAFYGASNNYIIGYPRLVGTSGTVTKRYYIPKGAVSFRTTYWNAANRATYGEFKCKVYYSYDFLPFNKCSIKMWIGSLDANSVLYLVAINFMNALKNYGANAQIRVIDGADHSIANGGNLVSDAEVITWFDKH